MRFSFLPENPARWAALRAQATTWLSVAFLIVLITLPPAWFVWILLFTDTFTVQAITIVDGRDHTHEAIRSRVEEKLGHNMFFIQTPIIEDQLLQSIPQIRDLHILRKLPATLKIIVQEKTPALLLLSEKKYYFVDQEGIAFEEARLETLPGIVLPVVKNRDQNADLTLGAPVISPAFVSFLLDAQKQLPDITNATIVEINIPSLAAREMHVHMNNNWIIKLDVTRELSTQLRTLQQLITTTIPEEEKAQLEYIDLRIPQRAYYKVRGSSI